jgi:hypothetical protein
MHDDLARIVVGLPIAAVWPLTLPSIAASRPKTGLLAITSAAYVVAPLLPAGKGVLLALLALVFTFFLAPNAPKAPERSSHPFPFRPLLGVLVLTILAASITDWDSAKDAFDAFVEDDAAALAISGLVACVFLGGAVVAWILSPFTDALTKEGFARPSLANAGRYIGWTERAVLFAFVIGGEPQAAAIALAAKSFARFPTLRDHEEGFAEYFLIGSLGSIAIAVGAAIGTRAALGIGPF